MAKRRQDWDAIDVATHAMEATSLSQLTLPEVRRMASLILNRGGVSAAAGSKLLQGPEGPGAADDVAEL